MIPAGWLLPNDPWGQIWMIWSVRVAVLFYLLRVGLKLSRRGQDQTHRNRQVAIDCRTKDDRCIENDERKEVSH